MKSQDKIPTSKVQRASKFVRTGVKVGGNYLKHYAKKVVNPNISREELDKDNARDIYQSLSELKGSALKVAQMMSMDKNLLPKAYMDKFSMAQYSAPPLSGPLVVKTFQKYFGKNPQEIFDTFEMQSINAASIGQVHQAYKNGQKLAVKIQYPGVAESIHTDLKMVKPFATQILQLPNKDIDKYLEEVESKLVEETDYELELKRSIEISEACKDLKNVTFTKYYPEYSAKKILTMDWLDGKHIKDFLLQNPSQEVRNKLGQALWDFYDFQIHNLKAVHADPHPGNFLVQEDGTLGVLDFGCVKVIPEDFYNNYFVVINSNIFEHPEKMEQVFFEMEYLFEEDTPELKKFYIGIFKEMIELLGRPFQFEEFDFNDDTYFKEIYQLSDKISNMKEIRESKQARGSKHSLYINRTYFGLYNILNQIGAKVKTKYPEWLQKPIAS